MESMYDRIDVMLTKLDDTSFKTENQEEKLTYPSYKLSTYEYPMDKLIINKMVQPLKLQVNK